MKNLSIGVFDSGVGGISVLKELIKVMPNENYIYYSDSKNVPYGKKNKEEIKKFSIDICEYLIHRGVKAIVIACNTATSVSVNHLRKMYSIPIIGIEPALKPAVDNYKVGDIVVLATEVTLREEKFNKLMSMYENKANIIKIPAPKFVPIVESGICNEEEAELAVKELFQDIDTNQISSVVLGCTHYPFLKNTIRKVLGNDINLIDGGLGTALNTKNILSQMSLLKDQCCKGTIEIIDSSNSSHKIDICNKLLNMEL